MGKTVIDVWVPDLTFPGWMDRWHGFGAAFNARHPELEVVISGKDFWTFPQEVARAAAEGKTPALAELYFRRSRRSLRSLHPVTSLGRKPMKSRLATMLVGAVLTLTPLAMFTPVASADFMDCMSWHDFDPPCWKYSEAKYTKNGHLERWHSSSGTAERLWYKTEDLFDWERGDHYNNFYWEAYREMTQDDIDRVWVEGEYQSCELIGPTYLKCWLYWRP